MGPQLLKKFPACQDSGLVSPGGSPFVRPSVRNAQATPPEF